MNKEICGCRVIGYDSFSDTGLDIEYCPLHAAAGQLLEAAKKLVPWWKRAIGELSPEWSFETDQPYLEIVKAIDAAEGGEKS